MARRRSRRRVRDGADGPVTDRSAGLPSQSGYFTAKVTPGGVWMLPMVMLNGTVPPGTTDWGICALICNTPEVSPGAAPQYWMDAGWPPIEAEQESTGAWRGAPLTRPSITGGVVAPSPVA